MNAPLDLLRSTADGLLPFAGSMLLQSSVLILFFLALWWWHPLLWFANHRLRAAREESVDDTVAFQLGDQAADYPASLVEVARAALARPVLSLGLVGILESRNTLRTRIQRLLEHPPTQRPRLSVPGALAVTLMALTLVPMAGARRSVATEAAAPGQPAKFGVLAHAPGTSEPPPYLLNWSAAILQARQKLERANAALAASNQIWKRHPRVMKPHESTIPVLAAAQQAREELSRLESRDPEQERRLKEAHDRAKNEYASLSQPPSAGPQLSILVESHFLTVADSALASLGLPPEAVTGGRTNPVMDAARLTDLLKTARTHKDIRLLGSPRILTLSHRAAEVTMSPSDTDTNPPPSITFTVLPEFLPDGRHLRLTMTVRVTETFDLAALPTAELPPGTDAPQGITVAPKAVGYRVRNLTNSTVVLPGQVVVMGYRAEAGTVPATPREGFVLVKATLVEPAETAQPPGNPPRP